MFGFYTDSPWYVRLGVALLFLGIGAFAFFVMNVFWPWAWGIGAVLLVFAIPSGKKSPYDF
ncbi:MAG: hypothetical protein ACIAQF_10835 [Phycisphaerales bacterium JB065]